MPSPSTQVALGTGTRKVALAYGHAASNLGDLAINAGVSSLISNTETAKLEKVLCLDLNEKFRAASENTFTNLNQPLALVPRPEDEKDEVPRREVLARYLANPESFIDDFGLATSDVVLLNSGEHLFESRSYSNVENLAWRSLPLIAAVATGKTVVQMPSTFGPFNTEYGKTIAAIVANHSAGWAARESASKRYMERLLNAPIVKEMLDPAFFLPRVQVNGIPTQGDGRFALVLRLEDFGLRAGSRRSSFLAAKHKESQYSDSQAFQTFENLALRHIKSGGSITVIVQTDADRQISEALVDSVSKKVGKQAIQLADPSDLNMYAQLLAEHEVVISSRFHACIIAMTQGVPAVGIYTPSHGPKMPGLFDLLGRSRGAVLLAQRNPQEVASEVLEQIPLAVSDNQRIQTVLSRLRSETSAWFQESLGTVVEAEAMPQARIRMLHELVRESEAAASKQLDDERLSLQRSLSQQLDEIKHSISNSDH